MKKTVFALVLLMLLPLTVAAAIVNETEARQKAQAFIAERGIGTTATALVGVRDSKHVTARRAPGRADSPDYYVFNIGNHQGFVIISADDRTVPVLGYADSGRFDEAEMPDGLRYLLDGYAEQMAFLDETYDGNDDSEASAASRAMAPKKVLPTARTPIDPLIESRWNQAAPYNTYCPEWEGETTVTGCVATAMAQVMYYHRYPRSACSAVPGYTTGEHKMVLDALPAFSFTWDDMVPVYSGNSFSDADPSVQAVAKLMQYCGWALQMDYGLSADGGSSAYNEAIPDILKTFFGYDGGVRNTYRKAYSYVEWVNLIYGELAAGRPVILGGQSMGGGHSFVCDGYDTDDYFHINWGWGGSSDGFFRLSVLQPWEQGIGGSSTLDGFSYGQDAIIGIQRPASDSKSYCLSLEALRLGQENSAGSMVFNRNAETQGFKDITIFFKVYDYLYSCSSFDVAIVLADGNGDVVNTIFENKEPLSLTWNQSFGGSLSGCSIPSWVADGTYYIKVMSRPNGTEDWQECYDGDRYQLTATISGDDLTIGVPFPAKVLPTSATLTITGDSQDEGYLTQGYEQQVTASIIAGSADYHGEVVLRFNGKNVMGKAIDIPANQTVDVRFAFTPGVAGSKTLAVCDRASDGKLTVFGSTTVTITESDAANTQEITVAPTIHNLDGQGKLFGNALRVTATVTNPSTVNSYASQLNCSLRQYATDDGADDSYEDATVQSKVITIAKGGTTDVVFEYAGLELDKYYRLRFTYTQSYDDDGTTKKRTQEALLTGYYQMGEGYLVYNANGSKAMHPKGATIDAGDALCLDLTSLATIPAVTPSTNPNCVYLLSAETAPENIPATLAGRNVVCGAAANTLTLTDGSDFFTPVAFTAAQADYTRTFSLAANGTSGWNTLFLPFAVSTVTMNSGTADEKAVDWFRSDDDVDKNFWLRAFTDDGEGSVTFDHAQSLAANTPYIIAVPDDRFGAEWQMTGFPVTFSGTNVYIAPTVVPSAEQAGGNGQSVPCVTGNHYKFCGNTLTSTGTGFQTSTGRVYVLNGRGSKFVGADVQPAEGTAPAAGPFRAWFNPVSISSLTRPSLTIANPATTGIGPLPGMAANDRGNDRYYSLDGRLLPGKPTAKGLYIYKGKKIVIK